jgi:hypothetical protein
MSFSGYDYKKNNFSSSFLLSYRIRDPGWKKIGIRDKHPEGEFLDINLTKDSSLLLHAIHSPCYWRILKKTNHTYSSLVLKILAK